jgi:hypothetical protein
MVGETSFGHGLNWFTSSIRSVVSVFLISSFWPCRLDHDTKIHDCEMNDDDDSD